MTHSQRLAADIRALERHLASLRQIEADLTSRVIIMGPGSAGRDALETYDASRLISDTIDAYRWAIADLGRDCDRAEITEMLAKMRRQEGAERANTRAYVRDLIDGVKAERVQSRTIQIGGGRDRRMVP